MPETLNFTQFCTKNNYTCDWDITDHGTLSPSGHMSNRARKQNLQALSDRIASNGAAHVEFRQLILEGKLIDFDGDITQHGLLREAESERMSLACKQIDAITHRIAYIESLGTMSHKKNGSLRKGFQYQVDELIKEREALTCT